MQQKYFIECFKDHSNHENDLILLHKINIKKNQYEDYKIQLEKMKNDKEKIENQISKIKKIEDLINTLYDFMNKIYNDNNSFNNNRIEKQYLINQFLNLIIQNN